MVRIMAEFQRPRGTRDFGPEEMARRRYVESNMRETARLFGFGEVMTPTFESTELFVERSGEDIIEEMYAFKDKGGSSPECPVSRPQVVLDCPQSTRGDCMETGI